MGHLYHGKLLNNQRVMDDRSPWINHEDLSSHGPMGRERWQRVGDSSLFFVKNQEPARVEHFRTSDQILFALFYHLFKRVHHFDSCPLDMIYQETVITCDKMYLGISTSKTWDIWGYHPENYLQPTAECPMGLWPLMN